MSKVSSMSNHYFTQEHEDAIIAYAKSKSIEERTKLYEKLIGPVINEMVDKIAFTYKFTNLPNINSLKEECKFWLTTILDKYDESKGSKAFSYFSVITKNWFIQKVKKSRDRLKREVPIDDVAREYEEKFIDANHTYLDAREGTELWDNLLMEMDDWEWDEEIANSGSNDMIVLQAIKELLEEPDRLDILNKKAIYLYLREITGLNTKQIVVSLKKFKTKYNKFKNDWDDGIL